MKIVINAEVSIWFKEDGNLSYIIHDGEGNDLIENEVSLPLTELVNDFLADNAFAIDREQIIQNLIDRLENTVNTLKNSLLEK